MLSNEVELEFCDYIKVSKSLKYNKFKDLNDSEFYKAAYYLGLIFAKEDYKSILLNFGVVPL